MKKRSTLALGGLALTTIAAHANASIIHFNDPTYPGLQAEAEFTLLTPTSLEIRLRNTSTGAPAGFGASDQILTGISFDLSGATITGGAAHIGALSESINFSTGSYGPGANVSGEWGYGNNGNTGLLSNFVSANQAHATRFPGANLDGPAVLAGPAGGIVANPLATALGGQGAIQDEVIFTLSLNSSISDLSFLATMPIIEFGSDAAFITGHTPIPAPAAAAALSLFGLTTLRRRR